MSPSGAPLSQLHQLLGQQQLPQQESSSQAHSQQQQQHAVVNRQSPVALSQNQAVETEPNQPLPSTASHSAAAAAATAAATAAAASLTQPRAGADHPQSSITCSDRPAEHLHSTATASDHPAPQQQSASVTLRPPSDDQEATYSCQSRGGVRSGVSQRALRQGGLSQGGFSQGGNSRRQVGNFPPDGEALSERQPQQVSVPPQVQSQLHSLAHAQQSQHVSQAHPKAQSHLQSVTQSRTQADGQSPLPAQLRGPALQLQQQQQQQQQQHQLHVPNPGVFGDEDDSSWVPDSPTPTLHYSPGPIGTCGGAADRTGSGPQHDQVCVIDTSSRGCILVQICHLHLCTTNQTGLAFRCNLFRHARTTRKRGSRTCA